MAGVDLWRAKLPKVAAEGGIGPPPPSLGSFCRGSAGRQLHPAGRQSLLQVAQWQLHWRCSKACLPRGSL
ncbi:hypothetical protein PCASD_19453, partial [Puccinia coronata f. sp. avenae]